MNFEAGSLLALKQAVHKIIGEEGTQYNRNAPSALRDFKGKGFFPSAGKAADAEDKKKRAEQIALLVHELQELPDRTNASDAIPMRDKLIFNEILVLIDGMSAGSIRAQLLNAVDTFMKVNKVVMNAIEQTTFLQLHPRFGGYLAGKALTLQMRCEQKVNLCDFTSPSIVKDYYYPFNTNGSVDFSLEKNLKTLQTELTKLTGRNPIHDDNLFQEEKPMLYDARLSQLEACEAMLNGIPQQNDRAPQDVNEVKRIWKTLTDDLDTLAVIENLKGKEILSELLEESTFIFDEFKVYVKAIVTVVSVMRSDSKNDHMAWLAQVNEHKTDSAMAAVKQAHIAVLKAQGYPDRETLLKHINDATESLKTQNNRAKPSTVTTLS